MTVTTDPDNERALAELLDYIATERERRREEILAEARRQAREIVREAITGARTRVREAIARERRERDTRLRAAEADKGSRIRQRRHRLLRERLDDAWSRLERCVDQRWSDPDARRAWLRATLVLAADHLPPGTWRVEHPPETEPGEVETAFGEVRERRPDVDIEPVASDEVAAGLRVRVSQATLDTTPAAVLARRPYVEGLLLGALPADTGLLVAPPETGEEQS